MHVKIPPVVLKGLKDKCLIKEVVPVLQNDGWGEAIQALQHASITMVLTIKKTLIKCGKRQAASVGKS